jgi:hypothetical protein
MSDDDVRAALQRHWEASDANDFTTEHQIYRADAVLEYPQSGERIRGRADIQASRTAQPNLKRFTVRRMLGGDGVWVSELVMSRPVRWSTNRSTSAIRSSRGHLALNGSKRWTEPDRVTPVGVRVRAVRCCC